MPLAEINGVRLSYESVGEGVPLDPEVAVVRI